MQSVAPTQPTSKFALWAGRIITALVVLFFLFDGVTKAIKVPQVIEASTQLGYTESQIMGIGILLLVCTAIYLLPQTAVLGAILLTGYMGGAIATHVNAESGLFPISFSAIFGVLVWLGLYLREPRLHALVPLKKSE
jgi:hypothetical protein